MVRRKTSDKSTVEQHLARLDKIRGRKPLPEAEKMSILCVFFALYKHEECENPLITSPGKIDARSRTARLFGRATSTVARIVYAWNKVIKDSPDGDNNQIRTALRPGQPGNRTSKSRHIPGSNELFYKIWDYIQRKRIHCEKITSREVLNFLIGEGICTIEIDDNGVHIQKGYDAALRAVQRYLQRNGFQRGKRTGSIRINPNHVAWRNSYIRRILQNRSNLPHLRLQEV